MPAAATVEAARAGDARALDMLVGAYLPLIYNIVGRALEAPSEVDDVVQDVMLQMVRDLRQLRDPEAFRSWLVAIAMRQIRGHWRARRTVPDATPIEDQELPDPGADFVDLTIAVLGLSDQRREAVQATRWLEPEDRQLIALWWLELAGELTRTELAAAMESNPSKVAVLVHRAKARLEAARAVVRALAAEPRCADLATVCARWDGRPASLWRKRIVRHIRECPACSLLQVELVPAEGLLAGLVLLPVPLALQGTVFSPHAIMARATASAAARHVVKAAAHRAVRGAARGGGRGITRWTSLPTATKAAVAGVASLTLVVGVVGVKHLSGPGSSRADVGVTATAPAAPTAAASTIALPTPSSASPSPSKAQAQPIVNSTLPVRAAFYYPWYPDNFAPGDTHYTPSAGYYSVDNPSTVDRQIQDMQYGGLDAAIVSWWGQGTREDKRMPLLMQEAAKLDFSMTVYYEQQGYSDPSLTQITNDLVYLRKYSSQTAWLHIDNLPVIFVFGDGSENCATAAKWVQAAQITHYYVNLKVFGGYRSCAEQPQGWHQYEDQLDIQAGYSAVASPGFWKYNEATPEVSRAPAAFQQEVTSVAESNAPFQLIVSYNEWGEGTAVESATAWPSASGHGVYMDILHQVFGEHPR
jgi:RNA polymerase sigma factor (sigma-70 family)